MLHNHVGVMKNPLHHDQSESSQAIAFTSLNVVNIFHHQGRGEGVIGNAYASLWQR